MRLQLDFELEGVVAMNIGDHVDGNAAQEKNYHCTCRIKRQMQLGGEQHVVSQAAAAAAAAAKACAPAHQHLQRNAVAQGKKKTTREKTRQKHSCSDAH
jgi:hypothetical protein